MTDLILVDARRADRDRRAQPPGEAQCADQGDVAGAGRGDRRAVRRRCAALRDRARRRREGVLAGQRHRRVRHRAQQQGAGDRLRPRHARDRARRSPRCRHPLVAQIHGICVGGGLEIAALCDLRICGEGSRFGAPIKNLGLVMAYAEMAPLVRLVGADVALEILLEGRIFGAAEAKDKRLVTRVVPDAEVAAEARATAQRIADGAPLVARWHKKFARRLAEPRPLTDARARRVLRLLRHRGLPDRLRGVPRQAQAGVPRQVNATAPPRTPARSRACACSSWRRSWPGRPAACCSPTWAPT